LKINNKIIFFQTGTKLALRDSTTIPEAEDNVDSQPSNIGPFTPGGLQVKNNEIGFCQSANHFLIGCKDHSLHDPLTRTKLFLAVPNPLEF
jgi:hypothetical protein